MAKKRGRAKQPWRKVLEGVARRQHEARQPSRVFDSYELGKGTACVVADQRDVPKVQGRDEVGHQARDAGRRQVRPARDRELVRAKRQVGD